MSSKVEIVPNAGDLVKVWGTRDGIVVGRYGNGYYEVLFKTPSGASTIRAVREQDISLVQKMQDM